MAQQFDEKKIALVKQAAEKLNMTLEESVASIVALANKLAYEHFCLVNEDGLACDVLWKEVPKEERVEWLKKALAAKEAEQRTAQSGGGGRKKGEKKGEKQQKSLFREYKQCKSKNSRGERCMQVALEDMKYCARHHDQEKQHGGFEGQCKAITADGVQCTNMVIPNKDFCLRHFKKEMKKLQQQY
jgi:hypothetical protein